MSAELLASIVVVVLSLAFAYIPGLKSVYNNLAGEYKALVMGLLLIVAAFVIYGMACFGLASDFGITIACNKSGALELLKILVASLVANQATYQLAVRPFKK